jgi:hypothetical protein
MGADANADMVTDTISNMVANANAKVVTDTISKKVAADATADMVTDTISNAICANRSFMVANANADLCRQWLLCRQHFLARLQPDRRTHDHCSRRTHDHCSRRTHDHCSQTHDHCSLYRQ